MINLFTQDFDESKYILATYYLKSKTNLRNAAWELAIGQSIGNPNKRSKWETDELFKNHSCLILENKDALEKSREGLVNIAFPVANIDLETDGISQLLCQVMGGQMDIDDIEACILAEINFPDQIKSVFKGPKFGLTGMREWTGVYDKPLLGGIVKPKVINDIDILVRMVNEMVEGGVNFIKEDEIMSNPYCCPLKERVKVISRIIEQTNVIYCYCINSDKIEDRVRQVYELGGKGIHINIWSGLGAYKVARDLNFPIFIHFQKSGDKVLTNRDHAFHIDWKVICDLAGLIGVDSIHAGMWGGYLDEPADDLRKTLKILHSRNVLPALSCGMQAWLISPINKVFGVDYMANVGGAIHGHPKGTKAGVMAFRQAIDQTYGEEYFEATNP